MISFPWIVWKQCGSSLAAIPGNLPAIPTGEIVNSPPRRVKDRPNNLSHPHPQKKASINITATTVRPLIQSASRTRPAQGWPNNNSLLPPGDPPPSTTTHTHTAVVLIVRPQNHSFHSKKYHDHHSTHQVHIQIVPGNRIIHTSQSPTSSTT
jgi:hypothetical protein